MSNFNPAIVVAIVVFGILLIPVVIYTCMFLFKKAVNDYKVDTSIDFPNINEIEYRPGEQENIYPTIGSFYIHKDNADKNPFVYPRFIYRVDSVKKNYYGDDWVKVSVKCYDMHSDATERYYPVECIPVKKFLEENSVIYKSKVKNIETYKQEKKREFNELEAKKISAWIKK